MCRLETLLPAKRFNSSRTNMPKLFLRFRTVIRILYATGALACTAASYGQTPTITTVAGGGFVNNEPALQTYLGNPQGVATDASGNVYISDAGRILRVAHGTAILSAVAGGGTMVSSPSDGPALSVRITPTYLAVNSSGNLLFLDSSMLRQLNLQQAAITTIAGQYATNGSTGDNGPAAAALLNAPMQFCLDSAGNIYIVELAGYVRRIDAATGVITTIAGNGGTRFGGDGGLATAATLVRPSGIAVDSIGNVYIADAGDLRIRKITAATGIINTIAGTGNAREYGDGGSALLASFLSLGELAIDSHNNLYLIDGNRVRVITAANGTIATVAGNNAPGLAGDGGPAKQAELNAPASLSLDSAADLYIADTGNRRIRLVTAATGVISTIAGTSQNGDGGLAAGAVLNNPQAVAVDAAGDLFIAESSLIRKVSAATGVITTFAGGGTSAPNGVPALQAKLSPLSLTFDSAGNLIVGEEGLILSIDSGGTVTTIAGTGVFGYSGDGGPAAAAQIGIVSALAMDASGALLFVDGGNKRLRSIDSAGVITTIAGDGQASFSGAGQPAASTGVGNLAGVAVDSNGNIYIGSVNIYYLLKISAAGAVSIAGGLGGCGYIGDGGPATLAGMCQPSSLALDSNANLYVGDTTCYCVRRIAAGTGIIQTVAGNGVKGYTGDNGVATQAELASVSAIALNGSTLYIVDTTSGVVRAVTPDTPPALPGTPSFSELVSSATFQQGPVAPGELITFYGHYLGPAAPGTWTIGANGQLTIPNANIQIFFDDVPAPLYYVSAGQVNAIAPYSVVNGLSTVRVQTSGGAVSSTTIGATASAPGIFPFAIVNQDGSINSAGNPAPGGSYVTMYGTGLGQTSPAGVDDVLTPVTNYPAQVYSTSVGLSMNPLFSTPVPMKVLYAGPAPGLVEGVCQIDAVVPAGVSGEYFMQIIAGPGASPPIPLYVE
jgi:uncharacterized protein (TIGR03437 family)